MATKINYSDLTSSNYETTIRIGTAEKTILFGDYGSCYGEYDKRISINTNENPNSVVDSNNLISNYFAKYLLFIVLYYILINYYSKLSITLTIIKITVYIKLQL